MSEDNGERTLLIADDDAPFRQRLARAMEGRGFIVRTAATVAEAVAAASDPPAYAVLDLRMTDGSGLDAVAPLRQARPDIGRDRLDHLPCRRIGQRPVARGVGGDAQRIRRLCIRLAGDQRRGRGQTHPCAHRHPPSSGQACI